MRNIVFFGTPDTAVQVLAALHDAGHRIVAVVTAPDRPVGRSQKITSPPVKQWAQEHQVLVLQPEKLNRAAVETITTLPADTYIVVAYGALLPDTLINHPPYKTLNVHYSLLPRYRGASPVEAALLNGDTVTGVSIQQMVHELDAGPIVAQKEIAIAHTETKPELLERLNAIAISLLLRVLDKQPDPQQQDEARVSYCYKIRKADGEIRLSDPDESLWNKYRAYIDWPGIYFFTKNSKRVKITKAMYENGTFTPLRVIPEGKQEMSYESFMSHRGASNA